MAIVSVVMAPLSWLASPKDLWHVLFLDKMSALMLNHRRAFLSQPYLITNVMRRDENISFEIKIQRVYQVAC